MATPRAAVSGLPQSPGLMRPDERARVIVDSRARLDVLDRPEEGMLALKMIAKMGLVVGLTAATLAGTMPCTYANEGGAIAAGVLGGAALGALAGSAAAGAYGPGYYAPPPPPPGYYAPVDAPPPRCHRVFVRTWDPYAGAYVDHPRRVCDY